MTFGITPNGFKRKTFADVQASMQEYLRAKVSKHLQLTEKTGLGNVLNTAADHLAELWEVAEACYHAGDPDNADEAAFVALALLTGTHRRGATKGRVLCTCNFDGGQSYPPGALIAHVTGKPTNRWVNAETVPDFAGTLTGIPFEAETAGAAGFCNAGTLTVMAQTVTGWNSITNPAEATPGTDLESLEALAVRREQELQLSDAGPLPAVRKKVSRVPGVVRVAAQENKTDYWGFLPPHSYRIIVWDGSGEVAANDAIAQAILDSGGAGIRSYGSLSGNAIDADGNAETVQFDRAAPILVWVDVTVVGSTAGVAEAIVAEGSKWTVGDDVVLEKVKSAVAQLPGVVDVVSFKIGKAEFPTGTTNIPIGADQIALFDLSRVTVHGA